MKRHITLDTESTGLGKGHRLIEFGAIAFNPATGEKLTEFHRLLDPEREVDPEATKVHGYTREDLIGNPTFRMEAQNIVDFITDTTLVIHNAPFDVGFLDSELIMAGFPPVAGLGCEIVDTLSIAQSTYANGRHTLDALCDRYGVDNTVRVYHGALLDCDLLLQVYPSLLAEYEQRRMSISGVLKEGIGRPLPENPEELAAMYLEIGLVLGHLDTEKSRVKEALDAVAQGEDYEGSSFKVTYQFRTNVDWKAVKKDHLSMVDLGPYERASKAMYVKSR